MACLLPKKLFRHSKMDVDSLIHCILCNHRTRKDSRLTFPDCTHTFCTACVQRHSFACRKCTATSRCMEVCDVTQQCTIQCPSCDSETRGTLLIKQRIPVNHTLYNLCDNIQVKYEPRNNNKTNKCQVCVNQKKAVFVCVDCRKWLCGRCWQHHQDNTDTAYHIMIKATHYNTHLTYKCNRHRQPISHHCLTCNQLVCGTCLLNTDKRTHKSHTGHQVETLSEIQNQRKQMLRQNRQLIHTLMQERASQRAACEQLRQQAALHYQSSRQDIKREMERLIRNITETGNSLLQKMDDMQRSAATLHENHTSYLDYTIQVLSSLTILLQELTQPGKEPVVLLHADQIEKHLNMFSHPKVKKMEQDAFVNIQQVPKFTSEIKYDNNKISIGSLEWVKQVNVPSRGPEMRMPPVDLTIPGGEWRWEVPGPYDCNIGFHKAQPHGLIFTDKEPNKLLVAEYKDRQVAVYSNTGDRSENVMKIQDFFPKNIALNKDQELLYVTDDFHKVVQAFKSDGILQPLRNEQKFTSPSGIATNGEVIVVSDIMRHNITVLQTNGKLIRTFGKEGNGTNEFKFPDFLILDDDMRIVVSDRDNHRVCIYTIGGSHVKSFGSHGIEPGQFDGPSGICQDQFGNFLVVDCGNSRVCRFTRDGVYERTVIHFPLGSIRPFAIAISSEGDVAISDRATDKIVVYRLYNIQ